MKELKDFPLLLGKKHMVELGLSEFQFYQLLKDPTLAVTVGKKTFISRDKLVEQLDERKQS